MTTRTITVEAASRLHDMLHERQWADADQVFHEAFGEAYSLPAEPAGAGLREALRAALHDECSGFRDNTPCVGANWHEQARAALAATTPVGEE